MKKTIITGLFIVLISSLLIHTYAFAEVSSAKSLSSQIIENPPPADVIAEAKETYLKIKILTSKAESGKVNYRDYTKDALQLKADYDIFSSEQRDFPELVSLFGMPVKILTDASESFSRAMASDDNNYKLAQLNFTKDCFTRSATIVNVIDDMFYEIKKKLRSSVNNTTE